MKKFISLLIIAAFCVVTPLNAAENDAPISVTGYIYEYETQASLTVVPLDGGDHVTFEITEATYIVDAATGTGLDLSELENGRVIVYALSESDEAVLILGNVSEDAISPRFGRVEAIENTDDGVIVTVDNGSLLVAISRDSRIDPFMTRNIVTVENIEEGSDLLMWFPMLALSYPAQAYSQRTVILSRGEAVVEVDENGYENGHAENGYAENGYAENGYDNGYVEVPVLPALPFLPVTPAPAEPRPAASLTDALSQVQYDFFTINEITMVPLRTVSEHMGFNVTWNESARSVSIYHADGTSFGTVVIGQNFFDGNTLEMAPTLRNNRTFVPVSFFELLLGLS